ncbi:MAG: outer membrane beta-barrel protein [Xanthobacteraceae bacterium]
MAKRQHLDAGGNAGYGWGQTSGFDGTPTTVFFGSTTPYPGGVYAPANVEGAVIDGQAGCNRQWGQWVVGIEGDFDALLNQSGQGKALPGFINQLAVGSTNESWQATLRARLGFTGFNNRTLVYVTGGGALMNVTSAQFITGNVAATLNSQTDTVVGWTVGGGVEYALTDNCLLRAEYLFVQIPTYTTFTGSTFISDPPVPLRTSLNENIVRFGVSYKFW